MTIPMPEPVAYFYQWEIDKRKSLYPMGVPVVTYNQAEAYADARVREVQNWISVNDQLPEATTGFSGAAQVLAFWDTTDPDYETGGIETSWFDGRNWQSANGEMDYHGSRRVTHWMPLPPPPLPGPAEP